MKMKQKRRVASPFENLRERIPEPQGAPFPVSEALEDTLLPSRTSGSAFQNLRERAIQKPRPADEF
jgi:hypothetical protein